MPFASAPHLFLSPPFFYDCCLGDKNSCVHFYWPYNMAVVLALDTLDYG